MTFDNEVKGIADYLKAIQEYPADQTILTSGVIQASFAEKLLSYARTQRKDVGAGGALA